MAEAILRETRDFENLALGGVFTRVVSPALSWYGRLMEFHNHLNQPACFVLSIVCIKIFRSL